jgi:hypothetical protein
MTWVSAAPHPSEAANATPAMNLGRICYWMIRRNWRRNAPRKWKNGADLLRPSLIPIGQLLAVARHHSALSVRKNNSPSAAAKDALVGSFTELRESSSNFGPALSTNTSPD